MTFSIFFVQVVVVFVVVVGGDSYVLIYILLRDVVFVRPYPSCGEYLTYLYNGVFRGNEKSSLWCIEVGHYVQRI